MDLTGLCDGCLGIDDVGSIYVKKSLLSFYMGASQTIAAVAKDWGGKSIRCPIDLYIIQVICFTL